MSLEDWPGMTRVAKTPCDDIHVFSKMTDIPKLTDRKVILLATATITDDNIFSNGLYQNVFFLLRMFEAMGLLPILIVNEKPKNLEKIPEVLRICRIMTVEDLILRPIHVAAYIEIGMSIEHGVRKFLKMIGGRTYKLYLGNILNIDIETPVFYPNMNFAHHVVGEIQDIWVSPHYGQHSQYARALNGVDPALPTSDIAPYVWDPSILTDEGKRNITWRSRQGTEPETFVIMEPNISFQKSAIIPLLILETWYRAHPDWNGQVILINGERLNQVLFFRQNILEKLELFKKGLIKIRGRMDIISTMKEFPSSTFLCSQVNNEYNYMVLELLWAGFPVVHNSSAWGEFGYFYKGFQFTKGAELLEEIRKKHQERLEAYKSHSRTLAWRHSPYNPDVQREWMRILNIS
jgi:hypothetical protein